jgi:hypothetical protein
MLTPYPFGGGKRLFEPGFCRLDLLLLGSPTLDTGALNLPYRRAGPGDNLVSSSNGVPPPADDSGI